MWRKVGETVQVERQRSLASRQGVAPPSFLGAISVTFYLDQRFISPISRGVQTTNRIPGDSLTSRLIYSNSSCPADG